MAAEEVLSEISETKSEATTSEALAPNDVGLLQEFLSEIRNNDAFDLGDYNAIEDAIASHKARHAVEHHVNRILDKRVRTLQYWGDQLDFSHTHRDLGQYFLQKHAKLIKAAAASGV